VLWTDGTYAESCRAYRRPNSKRYEYTGETQSATGDGWYRIEPDPNQNPFVVYCDQTTDGGGWTLIASSYANNQNSSAKPFDVDYQTATDQGVGRPGLKDNYFMALKRYRQLANSNDPVELRWYAKPGKPTNNWKHTLTYKSHYLESNRDFVFRGNATYTLNRPLLYTGRNLTTRDRDRDESNNNCARTYESFGWYKSCHRAHFWSTTPNKNDSGGRAIENGYRNWGPDAAGAYDTWYHLKYMIR
jgi:hypothetical protein